MNVQWSKRCYNGHHHMLDATPSHVGGKLCVLSPKIDQTNDPASTNSKAPSTAVVSKQSRASVLKWLYVGRLAAIKDSHALEAIPKLLTPLAYEAFLVKASLGVNVSGVDCCMRKDGFAGWLD